MRPKSVTVICWFLIATGGISIVSSFMTMDNPIVKEMMAKSPVPVNIQYLIMYVDLLISLTCGVAMLKKQNWARLLYVGWSIVGFIYAFATSPLKTAMIPSVIVFLIVAFFLFRPRANEFFKIAEVA